MKKLTILVLILAVPGFLYYLLTVKGKNRYKPLPVYGPKVVAKTFHKFHGKVIFDTIYHKLPDFELTDQDGKKINFDTLAGKVLVVSFFYTRNPQMSEKVNVNIDSVARDYTRNKITRFISITIDPEHDNAAVLKNYSAHLKANTNWKFLTGDTAVIYNLARKGLLVNEFKAAEGNFVYDDKVMLVDAERRIRGYYSGTSLTDMMRLNDELKVQISEELRKIKSPEM
ncbi:SCO family protein [Mucilaginibacter sp. HMF5004]|uniref:SCO family protein n=1 Tax=Mucilaginibacter rivuli TaxID=2857527 RepID=UPI001C5E5FDB|nr:SCO family protein [Mucilaginibacter rivuli]MBW4890276.1 SCO family protein [Mucilaginibacter rivuli]